MNNTSQTPTGLDHCALCFAPGRRRRRGDPILEYKHYGLRATFIVSESSPSLEVESIICMCSVSTAVQDLTPNNSSASCRRRWHGAACCLLSCVDLARLLPKFTVPYRILEAACRRHKMSCKFGFTVIFLFDAFWKAPRQAPMTRQNARSFGVGIHCRQIERKAFE